MIHLDECEPEDKGWKQVEYRMPTHDGMRYSEFCPKVEYMRNELFPDELVWVED